MNLNRRNFLHLSTMAASTGVFASLNACTPDTEAHNEELTTKLEPMTVDVVAISLKEIESRIEKAQRLLTESKMKALVLDAGTSMKYFTGISWWPSERTLVAIIPARGDIRYVCPAFEEPRLRELITIGKAVYAWEEDESPYQKIANAFKDCGIQFGNIGIEERLRFFILDGIRKEASHLNYVSGDPVSVSCRLIKSSTEIALMQKANDITVAAIKIGISRLEEGMSPHDFSSIVSNAHQQFGASKSSPRHAICRPRHLTST